MKNDCICIRIFKWVITILAGILVSTPIIWAIFYLPPDLHWRYSRDQVHHFLVWGEPNDTLRSAIEAWYITVENPELSRQEEIDSIENIIDKYNNNIW